MTVEIQTGRYPKVMVKLGGVYHCLTLAETMRLQAEIAQAMLSLSHAIADAAVAAGIDGALGEVARQTGGGHDQIMRAAVSAGRSAAGAHLDAIPNPLRDPDEG